MKRKRGRKIKAPEFHFKGTPSEVIERLIKVLGTSNDGVKSALIGLIDPDLLTEEKMRSSLFGDVEKEVIFSVQIAIGSLTHGADKMKAFLERAIYAKDPDDDSTDPKVGSDNLDYIIKAIDNLSKLNADEYTDLRHWIYGKCLGADPTKAIPKLMPMSSDCVEEAFNESERMVEADSNFLDRLDVFPSDPIKSLSPGKIKRIREFIIENIPYIKFAATLNIHPDLQKTGNCNDGTETSFVETLPYRFKHCQNTSFVARVFIDLEKNTFTFTRGMQFESASSTLRDTIPALKRALKNWTTKAKVIDEPTHVYVTMHSETHPIVVEEQV